MKVVYYLDLESDQYAWFGNESVASVRRTMPGVEIILLTTKHYQGSDISADRVIRLGLPMDCFYGYRRWLAHSEIDGTNLFLDVDCIVQKDLRHVFDHQFDIALAYRCQTDNLRKKIPFNAGVLFSRRSEFCKDVAGKPGDHKNWLATENRVSDTALKGGYLCHVMDGNVYNYTPAIAGEDISGRAVVHYKGGRKKFLFQKAA